MGSVGFFFLTLFNFVNIVAVLWYLKFMLSFTIKNSTSQVYLLQSVYYTYISQHYVIDV